MRRVALLCVVLAWTLLATMASSETKRVVDHARIVLGDIVPNAPERLRDLDLGPAPPPGGSRLISGKDVRARLIRAKEDPNLPGIPKSVRVVAAHRSIEPAELARLVTPSVKAALPKGVALVAVSPTVPVTTRPRVTVGKSKVTGLPRRAGQTKATAMVELMEGSRVVSRIPVPVTVDISAEAARPDVERGAVVRVYFDNGSVVVSARGEVLRAANVGDVVRVSIRSTRRVLRAKLVSPKKAEVTTP